MKQCFSAVMLAIGSSGNHPLRHNEWINSKKAKTEQAPALQGDMFVQHHCDQKLPQYTDSLERMGERVDFEQVAAAVDAACPRPDRSKGGRPPYPGLVIFKVLFLQALYNLSDEQAAH